MRSIRNWTIVCLTLLLAGVSYQARREHVELTGLRAAALGTKERAGLQKQVWQDEHRIKQLEQALSTAGTGRTSGGPNLLGGIAQTWMASWYDQDAQKLFALQAEGSVKTRFADLFRLLNLPPEQLGKLQKLLANRQTAGRDVLAEAMHQGMGDTVNLEQVNSMVQQSQSDIEGEIHSTLGDTAYSQYQAYMQNQGARNAVSLLQQQLSYTQTPISSGQQEQLAALLVAPPGAEATTRNIISDQVLAKAQAILSAPQFQALQDIQAQQQAGTQIQKIMQRVNRGGQPAPAGSQNGDGGSG